MAIDYYKQWLGITPGTHEPGMPPDHYTLLGLPHFCHHAEAVEISAKQRLEKLDKYAMLPDRIKREAATQIMNEVATARVALSSPQNYQRYDQLLAKRLKVSVPKNEVPPPSNLLPLLQDQEAYELDLGDDVPAAPTGVQPLDESFADVDGPEIHAEADFDAPRETPSAAVPFKTIIIALSALFILVLGVVIAIVMMMSGDDPAKDTQFQTTLINPQPADMATELGTKDKTKDNASTAQKKKLGKPHVTDNFDRILIGTNYRIRSTAGQGQGASVENEKLELNIGGTGNGQTRVEYTPMQADVPIKQINFQLDLDLKGVFQLALANGSVRFTITPKDAISLTADASPGAPPTGLDQYPTLSTKGQGLNNKAIRTEYNIDWYINETHMATSPSMDPNSTATVTFNLKGPVGTKASIDNIQVWYP